MINQKVVFQLHFLSVNLDIYFKIVVSATMCFQFPDHRYSSIHDLSPSIRLEFRTHWKLFMNRDSDA